MWFRSAAVVLFFLTLGCGEEKTPRRFSVNLARLPQSTFALSLSENNRPAPGAVPAVFTISGPFNERARSETAVEYGVKIPFRSVFYTKSSRKRPPEMTVRYQGRSLPFRGEGKGAGAQNSWAYDDGRLIVRLPVDAPPPKKLDVTFPLAKRQEERLNKSLAKLPDRAFTFASMPLFDSVSQGIYLPAPSRLGMRVEVPIDGELTFEAYLLKPVLPHKLSSDGARLHIHVSENGNRKQLRTLQLKPGGYKPVSVDLSDYAGREVELYFETKPGKTNVFDYVFLREPTLRTPNFERKRVLMIFVDTLRPDHMSVYGYERPTTPYLDEWSKGAVVFENARAPAPWTLPSGRAALSGFLPGKFGREKHLGELLADRGWATISIVSNSWLSGGNGLRDGWSWHEARLASSAESQVKRALEALDRHQGQNVALMVHFIDPHLPYLEPPEHRRLYEKDAPLLLPGRVDSVLVKEAWSQADVDEKGELKDYVTARYDQNIHYVDAQLKRLVDAVGDEATVVIFSDHGEEFWEHGGFEHGHTLYDELLRVPLLMKSPGLAPRRVTEAASLMDIVPSILALLGEEEGPPFDGRSLVGVARGKTEAKRTFSFGHKLFGDAGWAVLQGERKWIVEGGRQRLFDLSTDPGETNHLGDLSESESASFRADYQHSTGRSVEKMVRLAGPGKDSTWQSAPMSVQLRSDVSLRSSFASHGPTMKYSRPVLEDDGVRLTRKNRGERMPRELFVWPSTSGKQSFEMLADPATLNFDLPEWSNQHEPVQVGLLGESPISVGWTWFPLPSTTAEREIPQEDMTEALLELGYLE